MFCIKCGAEFRAETKFCSVCGAPVERAAALNLFSEEETVVAKPRKKQKTTANDEIERVVFSVRPTILFVQIGYVLAFFGAAILGGFLLYLGSLFEFSLLMWLAIPIALLLFLIPAYHHVRRNAVRYTLTDAKLEIDTGFFSRQTQFVALGKIQDVTVSASAVQRLLGYGSLVIDNAADRNGAVVLKNINNPRQHADLLLREMRRLEN